MQIQEPEIRHAFYVLGVMEGGVTFRPRDTDLITLDIISITQSWLNDKEHENQIERRDIGGMI